MLKLSKWRNDGRGRARSLARERDGNKCVDCGVVRTPGMVDKHNKKCIGLKGRKKVHDVHHLNGQCGKKSHGYDSVKDISGMITLCHKCHYQRHDFEGYKQNIPRNKLIIDDMKLGMTDYELASKYKLSAPTIGVILKKNLKDYIEWFETKPLNS